MKVSNATLIETFQRTESITRTARELELDRRGTARRLRKLKLVDAPASVAPATPGPEVNDGPRRHIVIPDCQVKPGVDVSHMQWISDYIEDLGADVVIQIGDFADFPSLSSYDKGKKSFEGRSYVADVQAAASALKTLSVGPRKVGARMVFTAGNHEFRCDRAVEEQRELEGLVDWRQVGFAEQGWEVYDFLQPVLVDQISYCHYFTSGVMGRPVSSARALVMKKHMSCVMGHVQKWDICPDVRADGSQIIGLFCGCCYLHDEGYMGPQGNAHWRGIWVLNEVTDGHFQPMQVSLDYLRRKYG